jgi:hypothetical protein
VVLKITGRLRNYYSGGACVHNWVKWQERESDNKQLSDVELTSEAIISMPPHECKEHLNGHSILATVREYVVELNGLRA